MDRREILKEAERCVCTDRQSQYGSAENSFGTIADLWNVALKGRIDPELDAGDVALLMALMKVARIITGAYKADSYIDACGYLSIGGEIDAEACEKPDALAEFLKKRDEVKTVGKNDRGNEKSFEEEVITKGLLDALINERGDEVARCFEVLVDLGMRRMLYGDEEKD